MIINFKKVHTSNFLSIGDITLDLTNGGYTLISGRNENQNDGSSSNGSGKSSIFDSIVWCLVGETIRGTNDVVNINGNDGAYVELDFSIDNDEYKVIRTKDHSKYKTTVKVFVNGVDKSGKGIRDSQKILEEYLGDITESLIGSVIVLGQGLPKKFTDNTPAGRKDILEKLSKSDFMVDDIKDRVSKRKVELNAKIREVQDSITNKKGQLSVFNSSLSNYKKSYETIGTTDALNECLNTMKQEKSVVDLEIGKKKSEIPTIEEALNSLRNEYLAKISAESSAIADEEARYNDSVKNSLSYKCSVSEKVNSLNSDIAKIKNIRDVCPTCGQKIVGVIKPDTSDMEQQLEHDKKILASVNSDIEKIDDAHKKRREEIKSSFSSIKNAITEKGNVTKKELNTAKESLNFMLEKSEKLRECILKTENEISAFDERKKELETSISDTQIFISDTESAIKQLSDEDSILSRHMNVISKFETMLKRDFRGYLLTNTIDYIGSKVKEYAMEVFNTDDIEFVLEGNSINIRYCGKSYENLSGGEKQKVDIIVQFSLREMLCKFLNFSSNILVVDEIFDALDYTGCQRVINLIANKMKDVESIYIITHHGAELDIPCDREITIIKNKMGVSYLQ